MTTKISTIILSHLNDIPYEMENNRQTANIRIEFIKYLVHNYSDTSVQIDAEEMFPTFLKEFKK